MSADRKAVVQQVLDRFGQTFADEAGIRLADKPAPLYQLLVLTNLLSTRINSQLAMGAARELFAAGLRTPERMRASSRSDRLDALGRAHYRRYDESTADRLVDEADLLLERWHGDLRELRDEAGGDAKGIHASLTDFKGIGPTGADIFLREVQAVWPSVSPYADHRVGEGAELVGLPAAPERLAELTDSPAGLATLAAALVRVSLDPDSAEDLRAT